MGLGGFLADLLKKNLAAGNVVKLTMMYMIVIVTVTLASAAGAWGLLKEALRSPPQEL